MTYPAESDHVTHEADHAAAEPICRRLFTIEQAAEFAGVSVRHIWRWIMTGKLEELLLEGGTRLDEVELTKLLSGQ
jgi:Helix-turn-helix domain